MPPSRPFALHPLPCKHHTIACLRNLSKHKMWDKFLEKNPNIWCDGANTPENGRRVAADDARLTGRQVSLHQWALPVRYRGGY